MRTCRNTYCWALDFNMDILDGDVNNYINVINYIIVKLKCKKVSYSGKKLCLEITSISSTNEYT